jgi:hypothetical protein
VKSYGKYSKPTCRINHRALKTETPEKGAEMEMLVIAVLLGLSLASFLTAKIAKALDMSYEKFLRLGFLFSGAPLVLVIILGERKGPEFLAWFGFYFLIFTVFHLIAAFRSKGEATPPCVPVNRSGQGRVARTAKEVASVLLVGFVFYFAARGSLPSLGRMSGSDMLGCGFFAVAVIIVGFLRLFQTDEICGNGLLDGSDYKPKLRPWEAYESFSWKEETKDGAELRLQAKSEDQEMTPLIARPEDREAVQQILEANLPDQLSDALDGNNRRIPSRCVRVRRTRRRRFVRHIASVLCWPAVVLLLVYLWNRSASWETFSVIGFLSIMITAGFNFVTPEKIEICKNGLLLDDKLRAWEEYECFFWKGETKTGIELRLPWKTIHSMTRLVVAPEDREAVQQLLEANLQDRSADSKAYSWWFLF